jgi:hypothetical protein
MLGKLFGIKFWHLCMRKNVEEKGSDMRRKERSLYGS